MLSLPYSSEVYFALMADYNARWLPAVAAGAALSLAAVVLALSGVGARSGVRAVFGLLGAGWAWTGALHQLDHMAELDFLAPVYGWAFLLQAVLLLWLGVAPGGMRFGRPRGVAGWTGAGLAAAALLYPVAVAAQGYTWREAPLAGTASDPTVLLTCGILLLARPGPPLWLLPVPLAWAGVAGVGGYLLSSPLDGAVAAGVTLACALVVAARTPWFAGRSRS
ncbi:DUF6064 family protein [Futiania mangrovi]|uniref:DUF6064 family protein n=1 Tax=Futiania mangrovi TaxID=2959716 RepID=A0A9J6PH38_9PROT|nr:DUF6064 family protein [Futiania mangrovii]MCP1337136.1 DUF6064 family protein [Futiania mangrovii]